MSESLKDTLADDSVSSLQFRQFGRVATSIAILNYLLPPLGYKPTEADTIFYAIVFSVGAYLAYSSIKTGHWLPRLFGIVVLTPYVLYVLMVIRNTYDNWNHISQYWLS